MMRSSCGDLWRAGCQTIPIEVAALEAVPAQPAKAGFVSTDPHFNGGLLRAMRLPPIPPQPTASRARGPLPRHEKGPIRRRDPENGKCRVLAVSRMALSMGTVVSTR